MSRSVQQLLATKVTKQPSGCWEWNGCVQSNGYGRIRISGNTEYVHRVAYRESKGPIPDDREVCHTCDNRRCCNPEHLFLGTRTDNMRDAKVKGRLSVGDSHGVHICGEKGGGAKLTLKQVQAARRALKSGVTTADVAAMLNVSIDNIRRIRRGDTWKDETKCAA